MKFVPLAFNTLRETIRDKVLYVILFFALLMIGSGVLLSGLSLNQQDKIVFDLGLSSISLFGLVITIFVGTSLLQREVEKKTVYLLLTKPIRRSDFILGKYIGLCLTLLIMTLAMGAAFYMVLAYTLHSMGKQLGPIMIGTSAAALGLIYVELILLTAAAIFFSTFATPVMSAFFTLAIYVVGHMSNDLLQFGRLAGRETLTRLMEVLFYVLPDLERLNLKNSFLNEVISPEILLNSLVYGLLYITGLLVLSMFIFEGKEF